MTPALDIPPLVAILTDFGTDDVYAGILKGVVSGICPGARLVDLTHDVRRGHIAQGSYLLESCLSHFPDGTIFLAVIDPGVGSDRNPVTVRWHSRVFVGPDNGLFSFVTTPYEAFKLENPDYQATRPSSTFHGRDIFAPAAGWIASGVPLEQFGPRIRELMSVPGALVRQTEGGIETDVIHIDHFGNVITALRKSHSLAAGLTGKPTVHLVTGGRSIPLVATFSNVSPNAPLAYWGSTDHLELAINRGSGSEFFSLALGDRVVISI